MLAILCTCPPEGLEISQIAQELWWNLECPWSPLVMHEPRSSETASPFVDTVGATFDHQDRVVVQSNPTD